MFIIYGSVNTKECKSIMLALELQLFLDYIGIWLLKNQIYFIQVFVVNNNMISALYIIIHSVRITGMGLLKMLAWWSEWN